MRDLEVIVTELITNLIASGSPLSDFTPQSVTYTLLRAYALSLQQLEVRHDRALEEIDFRSAKGADLDKFCRPFGAIRQTASRSTGWALFTSSEEITLPPGSVVTDLVGGGQYITATGNEISLLSGVETAVPITSTGVGLVYDLPAGTKLSSQLTSIINCVVGYERKYDGSACGALQGGSYAESDESLRQRWYALMQAGGVLTSSTLRTLIIQRAGILDARVSTPTPGVCRVIVRPVVPSEALRKDLTDLIQNYLIAAIVKVEFAKVTPLSVSLSITPFPGADLNSTRIAIKDILEAYIQTAALTRTFDPAELEQQLASAVGVVKISRPSLVLTWDELTYLQLGELSIDFKV